MNRKRGNEDNIFYFETFDYKRRKGRSPIPEGIFVQMCVICACLKCVCVCVCVCVCGGDPFKKYNTLKIYGINI